MAEPQGSLGTSAGDAQFVQVFLRELSVDRIKELVDEPVYELGRIVEKTDASVVIV